MNRVLFADLLQQKLERVPRSDGRGTYWSEFQALVARHSGCPQDWVIRLDTTLIRRERQYDKYEPAVTAYLFAALSLATNHLTDVDRLTGLFGRAFLDPEVARDAARLTARYGWRGLQFEALLDPTEDHRRVIREHVPDLPVAYLREIAQRRGGVRFESPTHLDAYLGDEPPLMAGGGDDGLGFEAKFTSDIDCHTTYSTHRNQIIRNVEVGNGRFRRFFFVLLTPRVYRERRSRFYVYKMEEYLGPNGAEALRRNALCPTPLETAAEWQRRIGWLTWEDVVEVVYPGGRAGFDHPDAAALGDFLRERRLMN